MPKRKQLWNPVFATTVPCRVRLNAGKLGDRAPLLSGEGRGVSSFHAHIVSDGRQETRQKVESAKKHIFWPIQGKH